MRSAVVYHCTVCSMYKNLSVKHVILNLTVQKAFILLFYMGKAKVTP